MYRDTSVGDIVSRIGIAKVVFQSIAYRYRFSTISMYCVSVSLNANLSIVPITGYSGCSTITNMVCGNKIVVYSFYLTLKMF